MIENVKTLAIVNESGVGPDGKRLINVCGLRDGEIWQVLDYVRCRKTFCRVYTHYRDEYYSSNDALIILEIDASGDESWHYYKTYREYGCHDEMEDYYPDETIATHRFIGLLDWYRVSASPTGLAEIKLEIETLRKYRISKLSEREAREEDARKAKQWKELMAELGDWEVASCDEQVGINEK